MVQSSSQIITTNKPTSSFYRPPNQQCQSTEGKSITFHGLAYPKLTWGSSNFVFDHQQLVVTLGEGCHVPLISPMMPVSQNCKNCMAQFAMRQVAQTSKTADMSISYRRLLKPKSAIKLYNFALKFTRFSFVIVLSSFLYSFSLIEKMLVCNNVDGITACKSHAIRSFYFLQIFVDQISLIMWSVHQPQCNFID